MNNVLFRRGDQTFIDENVPLNDGQIIFNETDEAIYMDNTIDGSVVRKRYGGGNLSRSDIDMALSTTSENPIANKVVTNAIGNLSSLQTDAKTNLVSAINEVDTKLSKTEDLISNSGDAYSSTKAYAVGDYVIYNNVLYRCITACSAGSWSTNQSCFTQDTLVNAASRFRYSTFTTKVTTQADSQAIGGNRGRIDLSTTIDPNYKSGAVCIPLYACKAGSEGRPVFASTAPGPVVFISSGFALNNDDVKVYVMYVYRGV